MKSILSIINERLIPWLALALGVQIMLSIGLIALGLYSAFWGAMLFFSLLLLVCLLGAGFLMEKPFTRHQGIVVVGAIAAVVICLGLYAIPAERIIGRDDQGTYSHSAVHLARSGQYPVTSPALAQLAPQAREIFLLHQPAGAFQVRTDSRFLWHHHIGYLVKGETIVPVFPPVYPVVLSGSLFAGGWAGLEWQGYLLLISTALLLWVLIGRYWGLYAGFAIMLLWLFFPLCLWFTRTYYAENLLVCLWVLILCLLSLPSRRILYLATGLLAGLSLLIKIDALLLVLGFGVYACFCLPPARKAALTGLGVGLLSSLIWFIAGSGADYFSDILGNIGWSKLLTVCLVGGGILFASTQAHCRRAFTAILSREGFYRAGAAALLLLALYAYSIRPHWGPPHTFYYAAIQAVVESGREQTLPRLAWYLTTPGLALAIVGILLLLLNLRRSPAPLILLWCVGTLALIFFCYDLRNAPVQPYGMRRLLVYAVPLLLAGFVYCFKRIHHTLTVIAAFVLIAGFTPLNHHLNTERNFPDMRRQLDGLSKLFPPGAIILTSATEPGTFLVSPLQIMYGIDSFALNTPPKEKSEARAAYEKGVTDQIALWTRAGRRVYFLTEDPDTLIPASLKTPPLFKTRIESRFYPQSSDTLTITREPWDYRFAVFEVK